MPCKLCTSGQLKLADPKVADFEYQSPGEFDYYECKQCGLLNIHPVPDESQLALAYPESYHAYHQHNSLFAAWLKQRFWKKKASRYSSYLKKNASILEAGCSFGSLLIEFRKLGFEQLKGVDFNPKAVEQAQQAGLNVTQGELDTQNLPAESFDLIVMENFIEHVYDPVATFEKCFSLLRPGGILAGETPNHDSWDYHLFRRHWGGYHTPRHLYIFHDESLKQLAQKTGFQTERISNLLQPAHWVLSVQNQMQDCGFRTHLRNGRSFYFLWLLLVAIPLNLVQSCISKTSSIEFIFRKPDTL